MIAKSDNWVANERAKKDPLAEFASKEETAAYGRQARIRCAAGDSQGHR